MANHVKFSAIEVGKTYFVQSRYWHKVLGKARITEVFGVNQGEVTAICDWAEGISDGTVYLDSAWDWFWDEIPNEHQQRALIKEVLGF